MRATLIILWLLVVPATANAGVFVHDDAGRAAHRYNHWARLARTSEPDAAIVIVERDPCEMPAASGCTYRLDDGRIVMELHPYDDKRRMRLAFWHELGHAFDYAMLTDHDRGAFQRIVGQRGPWRTDDYATSPSEVFARTYAACASTGPTLPFDVWSSGELLYSATRRQHAAACALIDHAATR